MKNHTQGNWITNEGQVYPQETGKTLALIPYFNKEDKEQEANAQLIAAAPKMLKALKTILTIHRTDLTTLALKQAENAIEKATR